MAVIAISTTENSINAFVISTIFTVCTLLHSLHTVYIVACSFPAVLQRLGSCVEMLNHFLLDKFSMTLTLECIYVQHVVLLLQMLSMMMMMIGIV